MVKKASKLKVLKGILGECKKNTRNKITSTQNNDQEFLSVTNILRFVMVRKNLFQLKLMT